MDRRELIAELGDISERIHSIVKCHEGDREKDQWNRACGEVDMLRIIIKQRAEGES